MLCCVYCACVSEWIVWWRWFKIISYCLLLLTAPVSVNWSDSSMKIHRLLAQIATNISAGWVFLLMIFYSVLRCLTDESEFCMFWCNIHDNFCYGVHSFWVFNISDVIWINMLLCSVPITCCLLTFLLIITNIKKINRLWIQMHTTEWYGVESFAVT